MTKHRRMVPPAGVAAGLLAAALFGASTPASKVLLATLDPLTLAASLYLGAGLALSLARIARRRREDLPAEAPLQRRDVPLLVAVVALGGVVGPVMMLSGLSRLTATTGSLLLNLEVTFTILIAVLLFGEHLGRREAASALLVIAGVAALAYDPGRLGGRPLGVLAIVTACLAWAFDNNFTQRLSLRDPVALMHVKTLGSGALMAAMAVSMDGLPGGAWPAVGAALGIGSLSYGASLVLHARALRLLGAARQAVLFGTAPFLGFLLSVVFLKERPGAIDLAAALSMLAGIALLTSRAHAHWHNHAALEHEHAHVHDEHHAHRHGHAGEIAEPHSHPHAHAPIAHEHPHASDEHHRHRHGE